MALKPQFNSQQIRQRLIQQKERIEQALLLRMKRVGEAFITDARNNASFTDRTGNLRSSIGYIILKDGEQIFGAFPGDSSEGKGQGEQIAEQVGDAFPTGFVLIVVAGMDYAAAVESKGYDVLTLSSKRAETNLVRSLQELINKVK